MVGYALIGIGAFFASLISFYSGFGLGTLLMPILAIFLPVPVAIGLTAVVHLFHNFLKAGLLWKTINWNVAIRFGSIALLASIPGALLLRQLAAIPPLKQYAIFSLHGEISILHIAIGLLLILFATLEAMPSGTIKIRNLFLGGAISGFFGGLSGNQGAFRSIFLINANLDKQAFISTNAVIATVVDIARLIIYTLSFGQMIATIDRTFLGAALAGAFAGICLGMILLKKMTITFIQKLIVCLLYVLGILLIAGII